MDKYHLLVSWRRKGGDTKAEMKKTPKKRASEKVVEDVTRGVEKSSTSSEYDDVLDVCPIAKEP